MTLLGNRPAEGKLSAREAERAILAEAICRLHDAATKLTVVAERNGGRAVNHVLKVRTATFDAGGQLAESFGVPAGSIYVSNFGTHTVTVVARTPETSAPAAGVGVHLVAAGAREVVALASREVTLYGTSGDTVSYQIFTTGPAPTAGLNAIDGGGA